jgi:nucleoside-diphosphate-sugar epimerase
LGRNILIWGGTGFIGGALLSALTKAGEAVAVLTRKDTCGLAERYPMIRLFETGLSLDLTARQVFRESVQTADLVFNVAGSSGAVSSNQDPVASLQDNCLWQLAFLDACSAVSHKLHVVFAGTRLVYGRPLSLPVEEDHPLSPESMYAVHKLCVEHYHQIYAAQGAITFTICRISNPYGWDERGMTKNHGILNQMIQTALLHKPLTIFGDGRQMRDYIHIQDLVHALLLCGQSPTAVNEIFNIGSGEGVSMVDAALHIGRIAEAPVAFAPWPELYKRVETGAFVNNIDKAQNRLGFRPKFSFKEGIEDVIFSGRNSFQREGSSVSLGQEV